jgi:hypothetical protein
MIERCSSPDLVLRRAAASWMLTNCRLLLVGKQFAAVTAIRGETKPLWGADCLRATGRGEFRV